LRLVVAGFSAVSAVVAAILAQACVILAETDGAVAVARALLLILLANNALKPGGFHGANLAPGLSHAKLPKCGKTKSLTTDDMTDIEEKAIQRSKELHCEYIAGIYGRRTSGTGDSKYVR